MHQLAQKVEDHQKAKESAPEHSLCKEEILKLSKKIKKYKKINKQIYGSNFEIEEAMRV